MNIDKNNPIQIATLSIVISFVLSIILLLLWKPIWIKQVNKKTGYNSVYVPLLLLYSILFSFVCGTIVFLFLIKNDDNINNKESSFTYG
jgi:hypothetical protein